MAASRPNGNLRYSPLHDPQSEKYYNPTRPSVPSFLSLPHKKNISVVGVILRAPSERLNRSRKGRETERRSFLFYVVPSRSDFRIIRWPGDIEGEGATGKIVNVSISPQRMYGPSSIELLVVDDDSWIRHGWYSPARWIERVSLYCVGFGTGGIRNGEIRNGGLLAAGWGRAREIDKRFRNVFHEWTSSKENVTSKKKRKKKRSCALKNICIVDDDESHVTCRKKKKKKMVERGQSLVGRRGRVVYIVAFHARQVSG